MSPSGDHVVQVSEIPGKRWDLALEQLDTGGAMTVLDGDPPIGLQRYVGWPGADGLVHVSMAAHGDATATVDYRLSGDAPFPA